LRAKETEISATLWPSWLGKDFMLFAWIITNTQKYRGAVIAKDAESLGYTTDNMGLSSFKLP